MENLSVKDLTVCATGHRPADLPSSYGYDYRNEDWTIIINNTKTLIKDLKATRAISGMALGYDTAFAIAVLQLQNEGYNIVLEAAIPCKGQSSRWEADAKELYDAILKRCGTITTLSDTYTKTCMQERNEYMVDNSDVVIAMFEHTKTSGGTYNCIQYAKSREVPVINIYRNLGTLVDNINEVKLRLEGKVAPSNITFINGDIFETDADYILHQVNCKGVMGAGIAKQVREDLFGNGYVTYQHICASEGAKALGEFLLIPSKNKAHRTYINVFGQVDIGTDKCQTDYNALIKAFTSVDNMTSGKTIAIPYNLGCGLAGGDWNIVYNIIKQCFKKNKVLIYVLKKTPTLTTRESKVGVYKEVSNMKRRPKLSKLNNLLKSRKKTIMELQDEYEQKVEDFLLDLDEKRRQANAYTLYITDDPRKGVLDMDLYEYLLNYCMDALRFRLIMILDVENLISSLINIEKYTYGFTQNPTEDQVKRLLAAKDTMETLLADAKVVDFIRKNNDYTVFGQDPSTRGDYISTYQKVLRLLTEIRGESLQFCKDIIDNSKDGLQETILDNEYEIETISYSENEDTQDEYLLY